MEDKSQTDDGKFYWFSKPRKSPIISFEYTQEKRGDFHQWSCGDWEGKVGKPVASGINSS